MPVKEVDFIVGNQHLRTRSVTRDARDMRPEMRRGLLRSLEDEIVSAAQSKLGPTQRITVRDLVGSDMPNLSNNDWLETTGGTNAWATTGFAAGGTIAQDTWIGIYGYKYLMAEDADADRGANRPPASAARFSIGGTPVAIWDLVKGFPTNAVVGNAATSYGGAHDAPEIWTESPIIVTERQAFTVEFWEQVTTLDVVIQLLGIVAEKVGTLNP